MRRPIPLVLALLLVASTFALVGCQQLSPEEEVAQKRSLYTVELNSWFVKEPPPEEIVEEAVEETVEEIEEEQLEATTPADEVEIVEPEEPEPRTIFFDLIVLWDGRGEPLPGITVEVSHMGADGEEKGSWLEWLEIPKIVKGSTEQVSFEREGVLFEEGDQFAVTLESHVPPEERDRYREFAMAGE